MYLLNWKIQLAYSKVATSYLGYTVDKKPIQNIGKSYLEIAASFVILIRPIAPVILIGAFNRQVFFRVPSYLR